MAEPEDAISIESGEPVAVRPRAIRFTAAMDMVILETVNEVGAHISQYEQSQKLFERVANACKGGSPYVVLKLYPVCEVRLGPLQKANVGTREGGCSKPQSV
jgi:hypothetical protein